MSDDTYGSPAKLVERTATDAAFELVKSGRDVVFNGRRDAVWRARRDGVVEVARAQWGRVELYEVQYDGTARFVAASGRSASKVAANICAVGAGCSLLVGVLGAIFVSEAFAAFFALMFVLFPLAFVFRWTSDVRSWIQGRFGSDDDWADMPWQIEGTPTTGNQAVELTVLADGGGLRYRVLDDGTLEVVVYAAKQIDVRAIDRLGVATITETLPSKRFKLDSLRGADVTWHSVIPRDPSD